MSIRDELAGEIESSRQSSFRGFLLTLRETMKPERVFSLAAGSLLLIALAWKIIARGMNPENTGFVLTVLDGANLIFHEAGHIIFLPFGEFLHYLGGSLTQVLVPALCAGHFWRHLQRPSAAVAIFWTGQSLTNVAIYISDARKMELPLIGGDHDWHYLLGKLNLLGQDGTLGHLVLLIGIGLISFSLILIVVELLHAWNQPKPD